MFRSRVPLLISEKEHAERRKITQSEIAVTAKLSRMTVYTWMKRDRAMPRLDAGTVNALCGYFDCGLSELVELETE